MSKYKKGDIFTVENLPDKNDARIGKVGVIMAAMDGEEKYSAAFTTGGYICHGVNMVAVDMDNMETWQKNSLGLLKAAYPQYFEQPDMVSFIERRAATVQQMMNSFRASEQAKQLTPAQLNELCTPKAEYLTDIAMTIQSIAADLNRRFEEMANKKEKQDAEKFEEQTTSAAQETIQDGSINEQNASISVLQSSESSAVQGVEMVETPAVDVGTTGDANSVTKTYRVAITGKAKLKSGKDGGEAIHGNFERLIEMLKSAGYYVECGEI